MEIAAIFTMIEGGLALMTKAGISIAEFKASLDENGKVSPEKREELIQRAQAAIDKL